MDNKLYNDHISQGIALMSAENYPAAKSEFEEALRINMRSAEAYTHLGNACANLGQIDEAFASFKNRDCTVSLKKLPYRVYPSALCPFGWIVTG